MDKSIICGSCEVALYRAFLKLRLDQLNSLYNQEGIGVIFLIISTFNGRCLQCLSSLGGFNVLDGPLKVSQKLIGFIFPYKTKFWFLEKERQNFHIAKKVSYQHQNFPSLAFFKCAVIEDVSATRYYETYQGIIIPLSSQFKQHQTQGNSCTHGDSER